MIFVSHRKLKNRKYQDFQTSLLKSFQQVGGCFGARWKRSTRLEHSIQSDAGTQNSWNSDSSKIVTLFSWWNASLLGQWKMKTEIVILLQNAPPASGSIFYVVRDPCWCIGLYEHGYWNNVLRGGVIKRNGCGTSTKHRREACSGANQSRHLYATNKKGLRWKDVLYIFREPLEVENVAPNLESPLWNTKGISLKYWVLSNIFDFQGLQNFF